MYVTGHKRRALGFPQREQVPRSTAYSSVGNSNKWFQLNGEPGEILLVLGNPPLLCPLTINLLNPPGYVTHQPV